MAVGWDARRHGRRGYVSPSRWGLVQDHRAGAVTSHKGCRVGYEAAVPVR